MPQIVSNLPWLVIWVVVFLVQSYFFRKKNSFGSLILLWLTLLVGIFWDQALRALVPGIPEMWLFGTQIWILFLIVAVRPYLNYRNGGRGGLLCRSPSRLVSVWVGSNQQKLCFSAELFDLPLSPHCFRFAVKDLAVDQMYWAAGTSIFRSGASIVGCQTPL